MRCFAFGEHRSPTLLMKWLNAENVRVDQVTVPRGSRKNYRAKSSTVLLPHLPTYPLKLIHTATPNTTQTGLFCRVWFGGGNWVGPTASQVRSGSGLCRIATVGRSPTQNALVGRHTRQDKTVEVDCMLMIVSKSCFLWRWWRWWRTCV